MAEPLENEHTAPVKHQAVQPQKRLKHVERDHPAGLELEEGGWPSPKVYDFDAERWETYAIMKVKDSIHFIHSQSQRSG